MPKLTQATHQKAPTDECESKKVEKVIFKIKLVGQLK
jgi:hypothetical protein